MRKTDGKGRERSIVVLFSIVIFSFTIVSCCRPEPEPEPEPEKIELDSVSLLFPSEGGERIIHLTSTVKWTIEKMDSADWLKIGVKKDLNNGGWNLWSFSGGEVEEEAITVVADENTDTVPRKCSFKVVAKHDKDIFQKVEIKQEGGAKKYSHSLNIGYGLFITANLLEFVHPEVSLIESEETLRVLDYKDLFSLRTDTLYNRVFVVDDDDPENWDIVDDSTSIYGFKWYIQERIETDKERVDFTIQVNYLPTGLTADNPDSVYDFNREICCLSLAGDLGDGFFIIQPINFGINISIGGSDNTSSTSIKGENVTEYIDNLKNNPDIEGFYIDKGPDNLKWK